LRDSAVVARCVSIGTVLFFAFVIAVAIFA